MYLTCKHCEKQFQASPDRAYVARKKGFAFCSVSCAKRCRDKAVQANFPKRFWALVQIKGSDDCWPWQGFVDRDGYGKIGNAGHKLRAPRVAYELHFNTKLLGLATHNCDNPSCCNPNHIVDGTVISNTQDKVNRGRVPKGLSHHANKFTETTMALAISNKGKCSQSKTAALCGVSQAAISRLWAKVG